MSSSSGSDSESDIEMQTRLVPQKKLKQPASPEEHLEKEPKKLPVKVMVHSALKELNSKKGASLYAIKKYMVETYNADTHKINFYIKKYIKSGVEAGTILQTKGIGASGSFRLAPVKKNEDKPKKKKLEKPDKPKKYKPEKVKTIEPEQGKIKKKAAKKAPEDEGKTEKSTIPKMTVGKVKEKVTKEKAKEQNKSKIIKTTKESRKEKVTKDSKKISKIKLKVGDSQTPAKKGTMMRKKSIGSIIKPPKMKPKMRD